MERHGSPEEALPFKDASIGPDLEASWSGGLFPGAGFLMFFLGIKGLKAQRIALLSYLDPMVSVAISLLVFGETLSRVQTLGAFCIGGSILFATLVPTRPDDLSAVGNGQRP